MINAALNLLHLCDIAKQDTTSKPLNKLQTFSLPGMLKRVVRKYFCCTQTLLHSHLKLSSSKVQTDAFNWSLPLQSSFWISIFFVHIIPVAVATGLFSQLFTIAFKNDVCLSWFQTCENICNQFCLLLQKPLRLREMSQPGQSGYQTKLVPPEEKGIKHFSSWEGSQVLGTIRPLQKGLTPVELCWNQTN